MVGTLAAKLAVLLLKSTRLSGENKMRVTNALLRNIDAVPVADIISYDQQGILLVNGRQLALEQAQSLLQSVEGLHDNYARKLIRTQVQYEAIKLGLHNGLSPDTILFAKAAIWYGEQEDRLISEIIRK